MILKQFSWMQSCNTVASNVFFLLTCVNSSVLMINAIVKVLKQFTVEQTHIIEEDGGLSSFVEFGEGLLLY